MLEATAFWVDEPGVGVLRREPLPRIGEQEVLVRTLHTGVSRGTETSVFAGRVPVGERARMRAPFQEGEFPGPVKYGYLNVGVVEEGPAALLGQRVFTLFPHQSAFVVPADAVVPIPDGVPARRAVLAGAVETAVNVLWDAAPAHRRPRHRRRRWNDRMLRSPACSAASPASRWCWSTSTRRGVTWPTAWA